MDVLSVLSSNLPKSNSAEKPNVKANFAFSAYPSSFKSTFFNGLALRISINIELKKVELSSDKISEAGFVKGKSLSISDAFAIKLLPTQLIGPEYLFANNIVG